MIVQIRGTSGSGKSTIVRKIIDLFPEQQCKQVYREGRKRPLYYKLMGEGRSEIAVIGHYETKCGGCDTISVPGESYPIIFDTIRRNSEANRNVLFEGLLISGDIKWTKELRDLGITVLILTTSLEECIESINERRKVRLKEKYTPVNIQNTSSKHELIIRGGRKLQEEHGISVEYLSREEAFHRAKELLGVL